MNFQPPSSPIICSQLDTSRKPMPTSWADLTKPDFGSLFLLSRAARPGDKTVDPNEVARVMKFFDRLRLDTAKKVVDRWKLDPDYLFAIQQVEGSNPDKKAAAAE